MRQGAAPGGIHPDRLVPADLLEPVSRLLSRPVTALLAWQTQSLHEPLAATTAGLWRVSGTALAGGTVRPWSIILKGVQPSDASDAAVAGPAGAHYWRREALLYQSGVLEGLAGVRAPRLLGGAEHETAIWLWLEDAADRGGSRWATPRYFRAARQLGMFNGVYLVGRPLPGQPFLSRDWLRAATARFPARLAQLAELRNEPLTKRCWPGNLPERLWSLAADRDELLAALDCLPPTFCHLDPFTRNLMFREQGDGQEELVAVDWAYAGMAPVGAELAPMVAASVGFFDAEPEQMQTIDDAVFTGYLEGLRLAGWHGDPRLVRFGYTASAALRYGLLPVGLFMLDAPHRARYERVWRHSTEEIADRWRLLHRFLLAQADEARRLLPWVCVESQTVTARQQERGRRPILGR